MTLESVYYFRVSVDFFLCLCVCVCVCVYVYVCVCVCVCVHEFVGRSAYVTCTVCGVLCGSIVWEGN